MNSFDLGLTTLPYYEQIRQEVERRIKLGKYPPNSALPTEKDLAAEFGVNRLTIRQALEKLKQSGIIESRKGSGTYINPWMIQQNLGKFYSFGKCFRQAGLSLTTKLLTLSTISGSSDEAPKHDELWQWEGKMLLHIVRLRCIHQKTPFLWESIWIPKNVLSDVDPECFETSLMYDLLDSNHQFQIEGATEFIEPYIADKSTAETLKVRAGAPLFMTERFTKDVRGSIIEYRKSLLRADLVRFSTNLRYSDLATAEEEHES